MENFKPIPGGICAPAGFSAAGVHCGIRHNHSKLDLALIKADVRCAGAGCYTTNKVYGAPITVDREHLKDGYAQAIVVNSGNANTCAPNGIELAKETCEIVAKELGISADEVNELTSLSSDQLKDRAKGLLGRLNTGFVRQQSQVEALRASIDASPYPCIVAGDFNNTPFSYAFLTIAGDDLTDAFSQAGFGFGRTFRAIKLYPLRIDFILADEQTFRPAKFSTLRSDASDHNGITALLTLVSADQEDKTASEDDKP